MTDDEKHVMKDAYKLLCFYSDPPPVSSTNSDAWWERFCNDVDVFYKRNNGHPLAVGVGCAIFEYAELIAKTK